MKKRRIEEEQNLMNESKMKATNAIISSMMGMMPDIVEFIH